MTQHYHPHVVQAATSLLAMGLGASGSSQLSGPLAMAGTTKDLAEANDSYAGAFRPAPALPKGGKSLPASVLRRLQYAAAKPAVTGEMLTFLDSFAGEGKAEGSLFQQHYQVLGRYERNKTLRREKAILIQHLHKMNQHLSGQKRGRKQ